MGGSIVGPVAVVEGWTFTPLRFHSVCERDASASVFWVCALWEAHDLVRVRTFLEVCRVCRAQDADVGGAISERVVVSARVAL